MVHQITRLSVLHSGWATHRQICSSSYEELTSLTNLKFMILPNQLISWLCLTEVTKTESPQKLVTFHLKWVTGTAWYGASSTCSHPLTPSSLDDLPNSQTSNNSKGVQNKARGLKRNTSQIELRFLEWHGIIQCGSCHGCFLLMEVYGYDISHRESPPLQAFQTNNDLSVIQKEGNAWCWKETIYTPNLAVFRESLSLETSSFVQSPCSGSSL